MTTLAIPAPQQNVGTINFAGQTRISSLLAGSMIWAKNTAAKLAAAPPAAQAGADLLARLAEFRGASRIGITPAHRARRFPLLAAMRYAGPVHVAESHGTVSTGTMVLRST